jgi:DNA-binding transcriptional LysR family regulator
LPHFVDDPDPRLKRHDVTPVPPSRDVWLLVHRDLRHRPLVRAVMEFLTDCIKAQ